MSSTSTTPIPQACESTITSMSLLDLTASSNASASTLRQQPQSPPSTMSMRAPQQRRLIFHELRLPPPRGPIRLRDLDPINLPRFHLTQPRRPQRLRLTPPRRSLGDLDPDNLPRFRLTQPRRPQRLRLTPPRRPKSLRLTPPRRPQVLRLTPPTRPQRLRLTMPQRIVAEDGQEITMEDIPQYSEHNLRPGETHDPNTYYTHHYIPPLYRHGLPTPPTTPPSYIDEIGHDYPADDFNGTAAEKLFDFFNNNMGGAIETANRAQRDPDDNDPAQETAMQEQEPRYVANRMGAPRRARRGEGMGPEIYREEEQLQQRRQQQQVMEGEQEEEKEEPRLRLRGF